MHSDESKLSSASPFLISKAVEGIAGAVKSIKKLPSGDLLIETATAAQSKNLLVCKRLAHISIGVTPHPTLNSSRGVIFCPDIASLSDLEILEELKSQNVQSVRRIMTKREDKSVGTPLFILTFGTPLLPQTIKVGYLTAKVRPYIPNPLRCFKCQRFGHGALSCRGSARCAICAQPEHGDKSDDKCQNPPNCVNCSGDHPASSRSCEQWKFEKEVTRLKFTLNISYREARQRCTTSQTPDPQLSYASATKTTATSVATTREPPRCSSVAVQTEGPDTSDKSSLAASGSGACTVAQDKPTSSSQLPSGTQTASGNKPLFHVGKPATPPPPPPAPSQKQTMKITRPSSQALKRPILKPEHTGRKSNKFSLLRENDDDAISEASSAEDDMDTTDLSVEGTKAVRIKAKGENSAKSNPHR